MTYQFRMIWPRDLACSIMVLYGDAIWSELPLELKSYIITNFICEYITRCSSCHSRLESKTATCNCFIRLSATDYGLGGYHNLFDDFLGPQPPPVRRTVNGWRLPIAYIDPNIFMEDIEE